jgi:TRAP transporter 4TM/12TM fusion protein
MPNIVGGIFQPASRRQLPPGIARKVIFVFGVMAVFYHLIALGIWHPPADFHSVMHLFTILILTFCVFSFSEKKSARLPVIDIAFIVICLALGVYFLLNLGTFMDRMMVITPLSSLEKAAAVLLLLVLFEATRRVVGLAFVIVIFAFLAIVYFGPYLTGIWKNPGLSFTEILEATVWTRLQGIWDVPLRMSATYVVLFFIFGKLMLTAGLGELLMSLCNAAAGGSRGGPAKVAVIGSALVGSISSGPVSNIAMTGTFTIPMMKRIGYTPAYAGAIEAAASTGASIVPPVMTMIVFIMAELTGTPVARIMLLAVIPAFFYYFTLILQVHFQAVKMGLTGTGQKIVLGEVLHIFKERGHLLIPLILLIVLLLSGYYAVTAVIWAILAVPLVAAFKSNTRMGMKKIIKALGEASQDLVIVAPACALSGIIMVALFQTGLGSTFSHIVSYASGSSLLLLVILGGAACLLLGTGVPPTPSYLMTVLIVAPLMVKAGLPVLVAHFFALYYSNLAFITPPDAVGSLVAASIAGANFWSVSWIAFRLATIGFIIPIVFVYRPALLLFGSPIEIIWALTACLLLTICLASAFEGWMLKKLNIGMRALLIVAGVGLIPPNLQVNIGGVVIAALVFLWQLRKKPVPGSTPKSISGFN